MEVIMTNRDRHAELDWHRQALQGRPPQHIAPARRNRYRAAPRTSGLRSMLAIVALSLVAAGVLLVAHAAPSHYIECLAHR
jgi:hypothetical protein